MLVLAALLATSDAPADQYFGRLQMSALRVRYETMQLRRRYETHQLLPEQTEHLLLLTEDAFDQWARLYPKDRWLASTGVEMAGLYAELPGKTAQQHALNLYSYVKSHFPATAYAHASRVALHRGVRVRNDPPWAQSARAPSPAPSRGVTAAPSPASSAAPSPRSTAAPSPAVTATP